MDGVEQGGVDERCESSAGLEPRPASAPRPPRNLALFVNETRWTTHYVTLNCTTRQRRRAPDKTVWLESGGRRWTPSHVSCATAPLTPKPYSFSSAPSSLTIPHSAPTFLHVFPYSIPEHHFAISSSIMSDDWNSVTKIGKSVHGTGTRETVARTQSEINAARRSGAIVSTDKKVRLQADNAGGV